MTEKEEAPSRLDSGTRASLLTLLSHLFLNEVDGPTLEVLRQEEMLEVLDKLAPGCRSSLRGGEWTDSEFDQLAAEYCRLFILPGGVSPHANVWLGSEPQQVDDGLILRIEQVGARLGIIAPDRRQLPTHAGWLLCLAALAEQAGPEASEARQILEDELLKPWIPAFGAALVQEARVPLYRALGSLLLQLFSP